MDKNKIPKKYTAGLSPSDKKKQIKSIKESKELYKKGQFKDRPKLKSAKTKRSSNVIKFEKMYGTKITDKQYIVKNLISEKGREQIIKKGKAAYASSGSRPNQTPFSWSLARLASVLTFGPALKVDKDIVLKEGKGKFLKEAKKKLNV
tara:strand:+ start:1784 stop:2227 length:444 start_codon:yes stop_codon:yes gene_type:complete